MYYNFTKKFSNNKIGKFLAGCWTVNCAENYALIPRSEFLSDRKLQFMIIDLDTTIYNFIIISRIIFFFSDFPLKKMTQGAYWVNSWGFQIPFPGMDTQGCKYLRHNCMNETVSENQNFSYPVKILTAYPPVSFLKNVKRVYIRYSALWNHFREIFREIDLTKNF